MRQSVETTFLFDIFGCKSTFVEFIAHQSWYVLNGQEAIEQSVYEEWRAMRPLGIQSPTVFQSDSNNGRAPSQ